MRSTLVLAAAGVAVAAAVTAAAVAAGPTPAPSAADPRGTSTRAASVPSTPGVQSGCWVPGPETVVQLTTAQAEDLTTRAVTALRHGRSPADFAAVVDDVLDVSHADAIAVSRTLLAAQVADRLTCSVSRVEVSPEKMGRTGLTPRAQQLRRAWTAAFGSLPAGGFSPGGLSSGHVDNSAHYEGRAVDVFFRPFDSTAQRRVGWVFAQWVAAHAERYHVLSVIYADHIWTSWASASGFRDYEHPSGPTSNAVLRHLDHVHVAVESGRPYRAR